MVETFNKNEALIVQNHQGLMISEVRASDIVVGNFVWWLMCDEKWIVN